MFAALLTTLVLPLATSSPASAAYPTESWGRCSPADSPETDAASRMLTRHGPLERPSTHEASAVLPRAAARRSAITVRVFVHILRTRQGGGVTDARARRQVRILTSAYAGRQSERSAVAPFVFRVVDIDRTRNANWYRMEEGTVAEAHAKRALHRGDADDLNLYIGMNRSGSLGWGTQPGAYRRTPKLDGVVIRRTTMAGGKGGHYSAGDAAVHETGHWLGLLHTFSGRCGSRGDLVADTPREARPSYTCPVRRNTCTAPGRDPVHNFMDYSYDSCMNQFTSGQVSRMRQQWSNFRSGKS